MTETRSRRRIRLAVESRGYNVEELEWEPIYTGAEKEGMGGGWSAITDRPYHDLGYQELNALSTEELLAEIDYWLKPPELCDCGSTHYPGHPLKGDPPGPAHQVDCRWRLNYHLSWWPAL